MGEIVKNGRLPVFVLSFCIVRLVRGLYLSARVPANSLSEITAGSDGEFD